MLFGFCSKASAWSFLPFLGQNREAYEQLQMEMGFCRINQPYSPAMIREQTLGSPGGVIALIFRAMKMGIEGGSFLFRIYWDSATGVEDNEEIVKTRAVQLRDSLTRMGPTFIKAGQVLASRPDIVREDYMNELCVLQVGFEMK